MESEKRYGYNWRWHCICDRKDGGASMTEQDVRDRLNALEAERDALRELVKQAHEFMCETGEAPIHLAKQFKTIGGGDEQDR